MARFRVPLDSVLAEEGIKRIFTDHAALKADVSIGNIEAGGDVEESGWDKFDQEWRPLRETYAALHGFVEGLETVIPREGEKRRRFL